mmetsp:Transcript_68847/g.151738  ORF Transcript_68847/g.151738 Transcript_68847/m.151738 type:complete len:241 (+) Transcript_68847:365-1087(+)
MDAALRFHWPQKRALQHPAALAASTIRTSPFQLAVNVVLLQEGSIVWLQLLNIWKSITLGVEIELVELLDPFQGLCILWALKVGVCTLVMPGIEGVKTDHVEATFRKGAPVELQHLVHVLIVPPGEHQIADAAARFVDAKLAPIDWVIVVRVGLEGLRENHCIFGKSTSHRKGVPDNCPLLQDVISSHLWQCHDFAHVMEQTNQVEPVIFLPWPLLSNPFGGLKVMNAVGDVHIRIRVIN